VNSRQAWFLGNDRPVSTRVFDRDELNAGAVVPGPAVIEQPDTTILVYPGQRASSDRHNNLVITGVSEAYTL
jgi:N-methylhydantoinase A